MNHILNIFRFLFSPYIYIPKNEKISDKAFSRTIVSSLLGIFICGICLAGLTWAWFSSGVTNTASKITSADFSVEIKFKQGESVIEPSIEDGFYKLNSGNYTVTLTASGTASTGYCKVELNENTYHTVQLFTTPTEEKPQSVTFTVNATTDSKLKITHQWGTYANTAKKALIGSEAKEDRTVINHIGTPLEPSTESAETQTYGLTESEQTYTVEQGDTLSEIANLYGTTVEVLCAYNKIESNNIIQVGQTVKIPPASYIVPETPSTQSPATESEVSEPSATEPPEQTEEASTE